MTKNISPLVQRFIHQFCRSRRRNKCNLDSNTHIKFYSTSNEKRWTVDDIAAKIKESATNKIIFMAGAGISTPSGIPDFRTPGTGLYDQLEKYKLPYAEAIFDINYFQMDQRPFFDLARELYPGNYRPNICHYFVRLIQEKEKLLRMYTQNIDGLERISEINPELLIEAHGTFSVATCTSCRKFYDGEEIKDQIMEGEIPKCAKCNNVVKPDIVFFGEQLPMSFWKYIVDMPRADLLIVMGTSLEVEPFASIAESVRVGTPRLLINQEVVGSFACADQPQDVVLKGNLVDSLKLLVDKLGWKSELDRLTTENEAKLDRKYPKMKKLC